MRMKMPETDTIMMKCICNTCESYDSCLNAAKMNDIKAFCSKTAAMTKSDCSEKNVCMDDTQMNSCLTTMDECVCTECPVSEEYGLSDQMYCKTGPS